MMDTRRVRLQKAQYRKDLIEARAKSALMTLSVILVTALTGFVVVVLVAASRGLLR